MTDNISEADSLELSQGIRDQLSSAIQDLNTSVENYTIAYQNVNSIVDTLSSIKSSLQTIDNYAAGKVEVPKLAETFGDIDTDFSTLKTSVETHYEDIATLCTLYLAVTQTLNAMLDATDQVIQQNSGVDINKLLKAGKLDELFDKNAVYIAPVLNDMFANMGKGFVGVLAKEGGKSIFGSVFAGIFGDTIARTLGNVTADTVQRKFIWGDDFDPTAFTISTLKEIFKVGIKDILTDIAKGKASSGGLFERVFSDIENSQLGLSGKLVVGGLAGFATTFVANVATSWLKDGKITWAEVGDSAVTAAIGTASSLLVDAVVTASGLGAIGGPAGIAVVACSAAVSAMITYGGKNLYEWIKFNATHYGDGVPYKYEHMTNEELMEMLNDNGYQFDVPKYGEYSAFDIAGELAKKGASPELIAFIEMGAGANVSADTLIQSDFFRLDEDNPEGSYCVDAKTQAIMDFFGVPDYWNITEEIMAERPQVHMYEGYMDEYNEQRNQMMELFGLGGVANDIPGVDDFTDTMYDPYKIDEMYEHITTIPEGAADNV